MNKPARRNQRSVGAEYERLAGRYLMTQGYEILEYNFRCRIGEVDIIAREGQDIVFCEVKYRSGQRNGTPLEAVDYRKQKVISKCALVYLTQHGITEVPCRFDVVGIMGEKISLIRNAFDYVE